jgi:integrase
MSVIVRPYRRGGWEVDLRVTLPDESEHRLRLKAPLGSKSAAHRWGEERERHWYYKLTHPQHAVVQKEVPTLKQFAPRFLDGHARANRQKPSGIAAKEMILRVHLVPALGHKKLDAIKSEDVQRLKRNLEAKSPKTVNNVLAVLSVLLKKAVEWEVVERMPCTVKLLPVPKGSTAFYDFDEFERLVEAARVLDPRTHLIILLGGEAGLRCGEMIALEWTDVDLANRQLSVQRSDWNGQVTVPKGGRIRHVPMTKRLTAALSEHRHLRSTRVLCQDNAEPLTRQIVQTRAKRAAPHDRAGRPSVRTVPARQRAPPPPEAHLSRQGRTQRAASVATPRPRRPGRTCNRVHTRRSACPRWPPLRARIIQRPISAPSSLRRTAR